MNIAVLLKQTPDTESVIRIASDGKSIVEGDLKWIMNPYDEFAVEAALRIKEKHGGSVTVISHGPQRVTDALRTALAMGADSAVLIGDEAVESAGPLPLARALAAAVRQVNPDIVLCGSRSVDYDNAQRGPMVAEFLGWPHLGLAVSLEIDDSKVTVVRPVESGKLTLEADLPALVTLGGSHSVWKPRYASLPGIMKAKKKPLAVKSLADLGLEASAFTAEAAKVRVVRLEMPPERAPGRMIDGGLDTQGKARELVRVLHEEARLI
ncbi:MAG: electron transfer flavoprotein subunit beta/FixA family protein [Syntrophobacteraceae bacterium]|nr:electron transfer flavoprotein subunit beta/FixA family protein [Desulfobacteraceae bacterium]